MSAPYEHNTTRLHNLSGNRKFADYYYIDRSQMYRGTFTEQKTGYEIREIISTKLYVELLSWIMNNVFRKIYTAGNIFHHNNYMVLSLMYQNYYS